MKHPPLVARGAWERLRRNQLNGWGFRRQAPAGKYVVDFLCHKPAMIVEVDGPLHDDQEQKLFDAARTVELEKLGFVVIRVKERVVRDAMEHVSRWITQVGELITAEEDVPAR